MKYRPEIDGLRTVAVLPVVFFHAGFGPFQGGFAGVDIFFVISGYLITSLIIGDIESRRFSIVEFYERRARRILPALFLVLAISSIAAWRLMYPLELNEYAQSAVATVFFSSNIFFWLKSNYFSTAAELKPLLHTWSLAVEEQYYLFFPLLMGVIWKGTGRHVRALIILAVIAAASMIYTLVFGNNWANAKFYLLPFRAWELLIGAICAIALMRWKISASPVATLIGLFLIALALFFSSDQGWPSWQTLLPAVGTGMVILFARSEQGAGRVLASKPMVAGGLISYSLYLWHQPLFAFTRLRFPDEPSAELKLALIGAAVLLAWLTWRFVEQPFRTRRNRHFLIPAKSLVAVMVTSSAVIIAAGLVTDASDGWPGRIAPSGLSFAKIEHDLAGARIATPPCDIDLAFRPVPQAPLPDCVFPAAGNGQPHRAILLGDSHATVLTSALVDRLTKAGYETSVATFGGCIPFSGYRTEMRDCDAANSAMMRHVTQSKYDLIVLAFRPQPILSQDYKIFPSKDYEDTYNNILYVQEIISSGIKELLSTGAKVVVFEPVPEMPKDIGKFSRNRFAYDNKYKEISFSIPLENYFFRAGPALDSIHSINNSKLSLVKTAEIMCEVVHGACYGVKNGESLYVDDNHLSIFGIKRLMDGIGKNIIPK